MKRFFSLMMALILVIGVVPQAAYALDGETEKLPGVEIVLRAGFNV